MHDEQVAALLRQMRQGGPSLAATRVMENAPTPAEDPPGDSWPTTIYRVAAPKARHAPDAQTQVRSARTHGPDAPTIASPPRAPRHHARTAARVVLGALIFIASVYVGHRTRPRAKIRPATAVSTRAH